MNAIPVNPSHPRAIAHRLLELRAALGRNQKSFYGNAGIASNTACQWEKANGRPELDKAMRLCETYGLTLDWIYLGDESGLPLRIIEALNHHRRTGKVPEPV